MARSRPVRGWRQHDRGPSRRSDKQQLPFIVQDQLDIALGVQADEADALATRARRRMIILLGYDPETEAPLGERRYFREVEALGDLSDEEQAVRDDAMYRFGYSPFPGRDRSIEHEYGKIPMPAFA